MCAVQIQLSKSFKNDKILHIEQPLKQQDIKVLLYYRVYRRLGISNEQKSMSLFCVFDLKNIDFGMLLPNSGLVKYKYGIIWKKVVDT